MKYRPSGNYKKHLGQSGNTFVSQAKQSEKIITGSGRYLARRFQESLSLEKMFNREALLKGFPK